MARSKRKQVIKRHRAALHNKRRTEKAKIAKPLPAEQKPAETVEQ